MRVTTGFLEESFQLEFRLFSGDKSCAHAHYLGIALTQLKPNRNFCADGTIISHVCTVSNAPARPRNNLLVWCNITHLPPCKDANDQLIQVIWSHWTSHRCCCSAVMAQCKLKWRVLSHECSLSTAQKYPESERNIHMSVRLAGSQNTAVSS